MQSIDELAKSLSVQLKNDLSIINQLLETLEEETALLAKQNPNDIIEISEKKAELSLKLKESYQNRLTLISQFVTPTGNLKEDFKPLFKQLKEDDQKNLETLNQKIEKKMARCQEKNLINRQIVATSLKDNKKLLNLLLGKTNEDTGVYSSSGLVDENKHTDFDSEV